MSTDPNIHGSVDDEVDLPSHVKAQVGKTEDDIFLKNVLGLDLSSNKTTRDVAEAIGARMLSHRSDLAKVVPDIEQKLNDALKRKLGKIEWTSGMQAPVKSK